MTRLIRQQIVGRTKGFTLVEVLTATAVMMVVSCLVFPVIVQAKESGKRAATVANLRNCGVALAIYMNDNDLMSLPSWETARVALAETTTFDEADPWRDSADVSLGAPFIGSYAYVRGVPFFGTDLGYKAYQNWSQNPSIMVSLSFAEPRIPRFSGNEPPMQACSPDPCLLPRKMYRLHADTSISTRQKVPGRIGFSWTSAFAVEPDTKLVEIP